MIIDGCNFLNLKFLIVLFLHGSRRRLLVRLVELVDGLKLLLFGFFLRLDILGDDLLILLDFLFRHGG